MRVPSPGPRALCWFAAALIAGCGAGASSSAARTSPSPGGDSVTGVLVDPTAWSLAPSGTRQFSATVLPRTAPDTTVLWSIQEGARGGTVVDGLYTAPSSVTTPVTYHVVATASADSSRKAIASVTVSPTGTVTNLEKLTRLASRVGLFGHKSTGQNLIDGAGDGHGMRAVWSANPGSGWSVGGDRGWSGDRTDVEHLYGPATPDGYRLLNVLIGDNGRPFTKAAAFDALLTSGGFGEKLRAQGGYAMMKWCFGDFDGSTDIEGVFDDYLDRLHAWKASFPGVRFLHMTVPLTGPAVDGNNRYREAMSERLRNDPEIVGDGLFDLADLEAVCNGTSCDPGAAAGQHDSGSYDEHGVRMLRNAYAPGDYCHPSQAAEEDWLGQKLIDFLYDHLG